MSAKILQQQRGQYSVSLPPGPTKQVPTRFGPGMQIATTRLDAAGASHYDKARVAGQRVPTPHIATETRTTAVMDGRPVSVNNEKRHDKSLNYRTPTIDEMRLARRLTAARARAEGTKPLTFREAEARVYGDRKVQTQRDAARDAAQEAARKARTGAG